MKTAVAVLAIVALASASPRVTNLGFRNLFKNPITSTSQKPGPRIIGGQEASPHSIPHQAFLEVYSRVEGWYCGGSLISQNYVLTAGHCNEEAVEAQVTLGAHSITQNENTQVTLQSTNLRLHENYDGDEIINDIGLIQLPRAVQLTSAIQVVPLPSRSQANNDFAGSTAKVSGWGLTDGRSNVLSSVLRYVDVQVITNRQCEQIFGQLLASILCTSGSQNTGSCNGDSGGPLTVNGVQVGVVSFGARYCPLGYPSAFTRVTSFLDWIERYSDVVIS